MKMYKTAFAVRGKEIDSCMTVEWPTEVTLSSIEAIAELRGIPTQEAFELVVLEEVVAFCNDYHELQLRAGMNGLKIHVVDTQEKPTDESLLDYAAQQD